MKRKIKRLSAHTCLARGFGYLVFDTEDREWSLWRGEHMHVSVSGRVYEVPEEDDRSWSPIYISVSIEDHEFDAAIMAARHLPTREAWQRYCAKLADVDDLLTNA